MANSKLLLWFLYKLSYYFAISFNYIVPLPLQVSLKGNRLGQDTKLSWDKAAAPHDQRGEECIESMINGFVSLLYYISINLGVSIKKKLVRVSPVDNIPSTYKFDESVNVEVTKSANESSEAEEEMGCEYDRQPYRN